MPRKVLPSGTGRAIGRLSRQAVLDLIFGIAAVADYQHRPTQTGALMLLDELAKGHGISRLEPYQPIHARSGRRGRLLHSAGDQVLRRLPRCAGGGFCVRIVFDPL